MKATIEAVNDARRKLLGLNPAIKSVTIVLGDEGFRLEVGLKNNKWEPPTEVDGIAVVATAV